MTDLEKYTDVLKSTGVEFSVVNNDDGDSILLNVGSTKVCGYYYFFCRFDFDTKGKLETVVIGKG